MKSCGMARLLEQTARAIYDARGPKAVHPGQWAVLRYLASAPDKERTVSGVASYLGVTHAPASRAVAALARKHYVTVQSSKDDRRVRQIDLTETGAALLQNDPVNRLTSALDDLDEQRAREFAQTLEIIYDRLAKA